MYELQITGVRALQILDSRGYPTVRVWLRAADGTVSVASAPSGASTGAHEAVELRDGGQEYAGRGVQKAVANVHGEISELLTARSWKNLADLDHALVSLDGTPGKSRLGANAIVAVSMAAALAFATASGLPLHLWIAQTLGRGGRLPVPHFNVLNGGEHARNPLEFQEFMIAPAGAPTFADAVRWGSDVYHALALRLRKQGLATGLGDEGGYAPDILRPEEALDLIMAAIEDAGFAPSRHGVAIALDPAANSFYTDGTYMVAGRAYTPDQMIGYYEKLITNYPIWSLEDPLAEDDTDGWPTLTAALGSRVQVLGDDLYVTSADRVRDGIRTASATAVLIKPNQAGTVSETFDTLTAAFEGGFGAMVSHRSGETDDTFVADLVVGSGCGQLKSGAPARGERVAKYNRLLEITDEDPSLPYGPTGTHLNDTPTGAPMNKPQNSHGPATGPGPYSPRTIAGPVLMGVVPGQPLAVAHRAADLAHSLNVKLICAYVDVTSYLSEESDGRVEAHPIDPDGIDDDIEGISAGIKERLGEALDGSGIRWSFATLAGDPARALGQLAESTDASVIVVGTRERGFGARFEELLVGSIAVHLTHRQHRPVLVVPLAPHTRHHRQEGH